MTPEERLLLQAVGTDMVENALVSTAVQTLFYGFSTPILVSVIVILMRRKSWGQVAIVSLGLGASTAHIFLERAINFLLVKIITQATETNYMIRQATQAYDVDSAKIGIGSVWINTMAPVVNDCLIAWRAWVLFPRQLWVKAVLGTLCFTSFVIALVSVALQSTVSSYESASHSSNTVTRLNVLAVLLSLVTNGAATALTWWILRTHLKMFRRLNLKQTSQKFFNVWRIVALLVQSGFIYGVLQTIFVIVLFTTPDQPAYGTGIAFNVIVAVYNAMSFIYPALTIYLIHGPFSIAGFKETTVSLDIASGEQIKQDSA